MTTEHDTVEDKTQDDLSFADIRARGEAGRYRLAAWMRVRGCIDFAALAYDAPLSAIPADLDLFEARWPAELEANPPKPFSRGGRFAAWRMSVLRALEAEAGRRAPSQLAADAARDDWRLLQDLAHDHAPQALRNKLSCLVARARKADVALAAVTRAWACETQDRLEQVARMSFRAGARALDALHDIPEIAASGLLPPRIGALPQAPSANARTPAPPALHAAIEAWIGGQAGDLPVSTPRIMRFALGWAWRRAVATGLFEVDAQIGPEDFATQEALDRIAAQDGAAGISADARATYLRWTLKFMRVHAPSLTDPLQIEPRGRRA